MADPHFRFLADVPGHRLRVERAFAADRATVWACYTRAELLERWFAPAPLTTKTAHMGFREGGYWHYAMIDPEGNEYWGRTDYETIEPTTRYTGRDAFTDASGAPNADMPAAKLETMFEARGDETLVKTTIDYASPEDLQKVIDMGMEEGIASAYENLDAVIAKRTAKG